MKSSAKKQADVVRETQQQIASAIAEVKVFVHVNLAVNMHMVL